jgi:hypothetical protein
MEYANATQKVILFPESILQNDNNFKRRASLGT